MKSRSGTWFIYIQTIISFISSEKDFFMMDIGSGKCMLRLHLLPIQDLILRNSISHSEGFPFMGDGRFQDIFKISPRSLNCFTLGCKGFVGPKRLQKLLKLANF